MLANELGDCDRDAAHRLNVALEDNGYRIMDARSVCIECKLADHHNEYPTWYICEDSKTNLRMEWPAIFIDNQAMACARRVEKE